MDWVERLIYYSTFHLKCSKVIECTSYSHYFVCAVRVWGEWSGCVGHESYGQSWSSSNGPTFYNCSIRVWSFLEPFFYMAVLQLNNNGTDYILSINKLNNHAKVLNNKNPFMWGMYYWFKAERIWFIYSFTIIHRPLNTHSLLIYGQ